VRTLWAEVRGSSGNEAAASSYPADRKAAILTCLADACWYVVFVHLFQLMLKLENKIRSKQNLLLLHLSEKTRSRNSKFPPYCQPTCFSQLLNLQYSEGILESLSYASCLLQGRGVGKILFHSSWASSLNKRSIFMPRLTSHAGILLPYVISSHSFPGTISISRLLSAPYQDYPHSNSYISLSLQAPIPW